MPWQDVAALSRAEVGRLFEARRGAIVGTQFDAAWVRMMEGAGWWAPGYSSADELWKRVHESGGWWDPFYDHGDWSRVFRKKSGRFDFRPDVVSKLADVASPLAEGGLSLILFEPLPIAGGTGAELPFLQALLDPGFDAHWETWGEIHPDTAAVLGIRDGAPIRVASAREAIVVRARVTERIVQGAIAIPVGLGRRAGGRWAAGIGANPLRLLDRAREPVSSLPDFGSARVLVSETTPSDQHGQEEDLTMTRWGMVIDLDRCTACQACVVACQVENNIPLADRVDCELGRGISWIRLAPFREGEHGTRPSLRLVPILCMHCERPPCVKVCPATATIIGQEGSSGRIYRAASAAATARPRVRTPSAVSTGKARVAPTDGAGAEPRRLGPPEGRRREMHLLPSPAPAGQG